MTIGQFKEVYYWKSFSIIWSFSDGSPFKEFDINELKHI